MDRDRKIYIAPEVERCGDDHFGIHTTLARAQMPRLGAYR